MKKIIAAVVVAAGALAPAAAQHITVRGGIVNVTAKPDLDADGTLDACNSSTAGGQWVKSGADAGKFYQCDSGTGRYVQVPIPGTAAAGGADTQVIYNCSGAQCGDAGNTYNAASDRLTLLGSFRLGAAPYGCAADSDVCWTDNDVLKLGSLGYVGAVALTLDANASGTPALTWNGSGAFGGDLSTTATLGVGDGAAGTKTFTWNANQATDSTIVYTTTGDSDRDGTAGEFQIGPAAGRSEVYLDDGATMPRDKAMWFDAPTEATHFGLNAQSAAIGGDCDADGTTGAQGDLDDQDNVIQLAWNATEGGSSRHVTGDYDSATQKQYRTVFQIESNYCVPAPTNRRAVEINWDSESVDWDGTLRVQRYAGWYFYPHGVATLEDYDHDGSVDDRPHRGVFAFHNTGHGSDYTLMLAENGMVGIRNGTPLYDLDIGGAVGGDGDGTADAYGSIRIGGRAGGNLNVSTSSGILFEGQTVDANTTTLGLAGNPTKIVRHYLAHNPTTAGSFGVVSVTNQNTDSWVAFVGDGAQAPISTAEEVCARNGLIARDGGGGTADCSSDVETVKGSMAATYACNVEHNGTPHGTAAHMFLAYCRAQ